MHPTHRRRPLGSAFLKTVKRTRYVYPSLQECQPQKFGKLDAETRQKHLKSLFEHGVDFPPCFFAQVVMSNIQDLLKQQSVSDEDWQRIALMITPSESTSGPLLDVNLIGLSSIQKSTSTELGSLLGKLVLETLLPLVAGRECLAPKTRRFCETVHKAMTTKSYKCAILYAAVGEAKKMADCVLMLSDKASKVDLEMLDVVMGARTGNKFLLRHCSKVRGIGCKKLRCAQHTLHPSYFFPRWTQPGLWKAFPGSRGTPQTDGPGPLPKGASPRVVECCRVAQNGSS